MQRDSKGRYSALSYLLATLIDAAPYIAAGDRGFEIARRCRATIEQDWQLVGDAKVG